MFEDLIQRKMVHDFYTTDKHYRIVRLKYENDSIDYVVEVKTTDALNYTVWIFYCDVVEAWVYDLIHSLDAVE